MPQIAQLADTYASQIFWLLIIFGLVFLVVGRGMVPKVMDTVALRDRHIADDLAAAQAARDAADAQEAAWRQQENANRAEAQAVLSAAKAAASAEGGSKLAAVQQQIDAQLAAAETRIEAARKAAATEIESVAVQAARAIVERLAGAQVAEPAAAAAVRKALARG
ncbi:MAG: ATPase [Sphingomonadales bacterium 12-68-11]|nr:MAG: ATPase [Sphingomonadales bacterium 12-68-11]